jgi:hypothetical protein
MLARASKPDRIAFMTASASGDGLRAGAGFPYFFRLVYGFSLVMLGLRNIGGARLSLHCRVEFVNKVTVKPRAAGEMGGFA